MDVCFSCVCDQILVFRTASEYIYQVFVLRTASEYIYQVFVLRTAFLKTERKNGNEKYKFFSGVDNAPNWLSINTRHCSSLLRHYGLIFWFWCDIMGQLMVRHYGSILRHYGSGATLWVDFATLWVRCDIMGRLRHYGAQQPSPSSYTFWTAPCVYDNGGWWRGGEGIA